jgi:glycosyltransferase involved in cell wall biosynthesis
LAVKVLHVLGTMNPGGVETWLLHVLKHIDRARFQFHFCTLGLHPGLYATEVETLGGKMLPCPKRHNIWSFAQRFRRILRDGHYDVVHSHVHLFSGAVLRWAQAEGVPMRIAHGHTSLDEKPNTPARRYYRKVMKLRIGRYATHGLAASRPAAAELFGQNWQADGRFRVLYYGIDLHPFQEPIVRDEVRKELGVPVDAPVLGHVGRFDPPKNHRFLLEIAGEIAKRRPDVHFLLIGNGRLRPVIEAQARAMGLSGKVHFVGIRSDVPRIMRGGMDVFVFPSLWEGLGLTLIEAQAACLNCIVADTVPEEVVLSPESLKFLSLSAGTSDWATQVIGGLDAPRPESTAVLNRVAQSRFSIRQSVLELTSVYLSTQGSAGTIKVGPYA